MIYVYIKDELLSFEADIRDLCMAFFPLADITYVRGDDEIAKIKAEHEKRYGEVDRMGQIMNDAFSNIVDKHRDVIIDNFYDEDARAPLGDNRLHIKSEIKRQLYNYLSHLTSKTLLWGTLTGIRPVTIVTNFLEAGSKSQRVPDIHRADYDFYNGDAKKFLKETFYTSDKKIKELIEIADKEMEILRRPEVCDYKDSYSIYVGVPFCKSTCLYCSFTSFNIEKYKDYVERYLDALEREMKYETRWERFKDGYKPLTLYIGGGTPTSLSEEQFERLLTIIDKYVKRDNLLEYTVEAGRPDTITEAKLRTMKAHGVTRISINPQTMNQKTLDLIGRKHTVKDIIEKYKLARSLGFDNINMDIILGLPNEHIFDVFKTLIAIKKLRPDSLTVHSLALKRAARLNYELDSWTKNFFLAGINGVSEMVRMFDLSDFFARLMRLKPYYLYRQKNMAGNLENVGYTKEGKECIYNIMMMSERHTVYGFGCGTTKEVFYEENGKRVESTEGYKSVIDYCKEYENK